MDDASSMLQDEVYPNWGIHFNLSDCAKFCNTFCNIKLS